MDQPEPVFEVRGHPPAIVLVVEDKVLGVVGQIEGVEHRLGDCVSVVEVKLAEVEAVDIGDHVFDALPEEVEIEGEGAGEGRVVLVPEETLDGWVESAQSGVVL